MEKPSTEPSHVENSPGSLACIPESSTADSTPTLTMRGAPRTKDFVNGDDDKSGEESKKTEEGRRMESIYEDKMLEVTRSRDGSQRYSSSRRQSDGSSLASVPIADQMTVPPLEEIHPQSRSQ